MKPLAYALFLTAALIAAVVFLRSLSSPQRPVPARVSGPVVRTELPSSSGIDPEDLQGASSQDLFEMGTELLSLWHPREAAVALQKTVAVDSTHYFAWVRLVECNDDPLLRREDDRMTAWEHAVEFVPTPEDSFFLMGLKDLYIDHNYAQAIGNFQTALRFEVSHPDTRLYLARAFHRAGYVNETERQLEELLAEDDTNGRVLELSARAAVAAGNFDVALERAQQLARMYTEEPEPYVLLAQIEQLRGEHDNAIEFCNNALILDPRNVTAIMTRANLYVVDGEFDAARVSFEKLLMFGDPILRSIGHNGVAFVEFLNGNFDAGVEAMDEAIRYAMLGGSARTGLSLAMELVVYLCELGQADAAEDVVNRWVSAFGEIPVHLGRVRVNILNGRIESAQRVLVMMRTNEDWGKWSRDMGMDHTELAALTQLGNNRVDDALDLLQRAGLETGPPPNNTTHKFLLGYAFFESGDAESADSAFGQARSQVFGLEFPFRSDPVLYVESLFYMGESALARGDEQQARESYSLFLSKWGETSWDISAVRRAREKLAQLGETSAD